MNDTLKTKRFYIIPACTLILAGLVLMAHAMYRVRHATLADGRLRIFRKVGAGIFPGLHSPVDKGMHLLRLLDVRGCTTTQPPSRRSGNKAA